ncbi:NHL repeat-containing protein [Granulicella mallensis]|nr:hypothetical protein [Granulicella mallensis]
MFPARSGLSPRLAAPALACMVLSLSGCSANFGGSAATSTATSFSIKGIAHGGQQPLFGSHVHLLAAGTSGYASAATDVLTLGSLPTDLFGHYVTTDAGGNFSLAGAVNCTATAGNDQLLYLYSTEGDPQPGGEGTDPTPVPNPSASLLAVVGACSTIGNIPFVYMNEVTTVAAAYALSGFAIDGAHIGAPSAVAGHALAGTGITNAFNTALNIVGQTTGQPLATTPAGNGTVPVTEINTLADILAGCVNSTGPGSSGCATLFTDTNTSASSDTVAAAMNIAHNPAVQVSSLLGLANNGSPFQPFLTTANDFTLTVSYTGGGLNQPFCVAIDGSGNVWAANLVNSLSKLSPLGAAISGSAGYSGAGVLNLPTSIAIDNSGTVWVTSNIGNDLAKFTSSGAVISEITGAGIAGPTSIAIDGLGNHWTANLSNSTLTELDFSETVGIPHAGNNVNLPDGVAIDGSNNVWAANMGSGTVSEFNSAGMAVSNYSGGGLVDPIAIAVDGSNEVWVANGTGSVSEFNSSGVALSGSAGYTGGGLNEPEAIAIDGAGNVWVSNIGNDVLSEFNPSGVALSGSTGYTGGLKSPQSLAIDGAGNVWVTNTRNNALTEFIGAAAPVVTPMQANLTTGTKQPAQKP